MLSSDDARQDYQEFEYRVAKNRDLLEKRGIKVNKVDILRRPDMYVDSYMYDYKGGPMRINHERLDAHWYISMNDREMQRFATQDEALREIGERADDYREELTRSRSDLNRMRDKIGRLKQVVHQTPGIKEQWDEMMTMLKLAGFDEDLL